MPNVETKAVKVEVNGQVIPIKTVGGGEKAQGQNYVTELALVSYITPTSMALSDAADAVGNKGQNQRYLITITDTADGKTRVYEDCLLKLMVLSPMDASSGDLATRTTLWQPTKLTMTQGAAGAVAAPPVSGLSQNGVTGRNVMRVDHAGGRVEQTAANQWTEYDAKGVAHFTFAETGRDDSTVYLNDSSRNIQLQLNTQRRMITYSANCAQRTDLYPITAAWRR